MRQKLLVSFSFSFLFSFPLFWRTRICEFIFLARARILMYIILGILVLQCFLVRELSEKAQLLISIIKAFKYINRFRSCYKY